MAGTDNIYEELSTAECLELLGQHRFGRIAVVTDGHPIVFPINYLLDGEEIVFRTAPGTKLAGANLGQVAFEIDAVDEAAGTGWSVIVQGVGHDITSAMDRQSERLRELQVQPWVPGDRPHWVKILAQSVTGRRLR